MKRIEAIRYREALTGRAVKTLRDCTADVVGSRVRVLLRVEGITYLDARHGRRLERYFHPFDPPYPLLVEDGGERHTRDVPRPPVKLARFAPQLVALEGTQPDGRPGIYRAPPGLQLATDRRALYLLRVGQKARAESPLYIARNRSRYRVTEAGIVG